MLGADDIGQGGFFHSRVVQVGVHGVAMQIGIARGARRLAMGVVVEQWQQSVYDGHRTAEQMELAEELDRA